MAFGSAPRGTPAGTPARPHRKKRLCDHVREFDDKLPDDACGFSQQNGEALRMHLLSLNFTALEIKTCIECYRDNGYFSTRGHHCKSVRPTQERAHTSAARVTSQAASSVVTAAPGGTTVTATSSNATMAIDAPLTATQSPSPQPKHGTTTAYTLWVLLDGIVRTADNGGRNIVVSVSRLEEARRLARVLNEEDGRCYESKKIQEQLEEIKEQLSNALPQPLTQPKCAQETPRRDLSKERSPTPAPPTTHPGEAPASPLQPIYTQCSAEPRSRGAESSLRPVTAYTAEELSLATDLSTGARRTDGCTLTYNKRSSDTHTQAIAQAHTQNARGGVMAGLLSPPPSVRPSPSPSRSPPPPNRPASRTATPSLGMPAPPARLGEALTTPGPEPPARTDMDRSTPAEHNYDRSYAGRVAVRRPRTDRYKHTQSTARAAAYVRTRAATRVIVRFTMGTPEKKDRLGAQVMRDTINKALSAAGIQVCGAQFTRAGNVAVTPLAPHTNADLLSHAALIKKCTAHGQNVDTLVMEPDEPWPSIVVRGVQIPQGGDVWETERVLCEELGRWNPVLRLGVREVRVMRKLEDVGKGERDPIRIAFTTVEGQAAALKEGICAFGEKLRASLYRSRG